MDVFVSWSGGKDCMLALNRILKEGKHQVKALVNMCSPNGKHSGSHGLKKDIIEEQARQLNIPIIQQAVTNEGYEVCFKAIIANLKEEGITAGVFGDIYLEPHRTWIDRVCSEMDITPIYPLWECNTNDLLAEFISEGFQSITVSVNSKHLDKSWLGKELNKKFFDTISKLPEIDACAENGEYHSFVFNGPVFQNRVSYKTGETRFEHDHWLIDIEVANEF